MMIESERIMKGTIHEKIWIIYNDALTILTSKLTKDWMVGKDYLERWYLPSGNSHNDLSAAGRNLYQGTPIKNFPEYVSLDTHLNQDIHTSHDYHFAPTQDTADDNPRKFPGTNTRTVPAELETRQDQCNRMMPYTTWNSLDMMDKLLLRHAMRKVML